MTVADPECDGCGLSVTNPITNHAIYISPRPLMSPWWPRGVFSGAWVWLWGSRSVRMMVQPTVVRGHAQELGEFTHRIIFGTLPLQIYFDGFFLPPLQLILHPKLNKST